MNGDYLLVIEGIKGEYPDSKHPNAIEVDAFAWGHENHGTAAQGGGAGAGRVEFKDVKFTSTVSAASPELAQACAGGKHFKKAQLFVRKQGDEQQEYYVITLEDFIVSEFDSGGNSSSGLPQDVFTLNFSTIKFEYRKQNNDGTLDAAITMGWNLKTNKKL
jgi:type VI secretion system secreted protein Hcp